MHLLFKHSLEHMMQDLSMCIYLFYPVLKDPFLIRLIPIHVHQILYKKSSDKSRSSIHCLMYDYTCTNE